MNSSLKRYDYYAGPKTLEDRWTLTRGDLTLRCRLSTHSLGWELRLSTNASFARSQVCKTESEVFATADAWRAEALAKGWSEPR
jgi:hypothetical protein